MKTTSRIAFAAAALIAVGALGTTAYAYRDGGHGGYHGGGHGMGHGGYHKRGHGMRHGRHGMRRHMKHMMERYDANKDGKVTQDEINSNREAWLKEFDADNNGQLSLDEFKQLYLKARERRIVREFQRFDTDGNAGVTLEEYQEPLAEMVERHDRNGDGALSRDDRRGYGKRHNRMEQDDSGATDEAEQNADEPSEGESTNQ